MFRPRGAGRQKERVTILFSESATFVVTRARRHKREDGRPLSPGIQSDSCNSIEDRPEQAFQDLGLENTPVVTSERCAS
ncbi:hypothetical protein RRG08_026502 [Elysia crispata]|uniref:Uncharacterized protein n=1 Tax=Elysia crispata TaxID=231223 RepID=A0AAE1CSA7_9GAST|nr:hypothetical protein RRG08_026502 [Elysia crispata]